MPQDVGQGLLERPKKGELGFPRECGHDGRHREPGWYPTALAEIGSCHSNGTGR
jgi:hypothetical protein